jgi:Ser/Thr protein kinase RdoA (MazF antagonist)
MIEGLDLLFAGEPSAFGLGARLNEFIGKNHGSGRLMMQERIKSQVYRLHLELDDEPLTLILKCMEGRIARGNELAARRWLPAVGLAEAGPPLLTTIGTPDGQFVWHAYSDLGANSLAEDMESTRKVEATVRFIAELHRRFIDHPYMAEFRLSGGDLGAHFVESSLRDANLTLESLTKDQKAKDSNWAVVDRLLERVSGLMGQLPSRLKLLRELSGPETLLHGDLWLSNIFVLPDEQIRLIDWDRAGAGPIAYDLSTFILRFPPKQRSELIELYREAARPSGWEMPAYKELNHIFETFELARYACVMIWPAIALWESGAELALEQLEEIERWFEAWAPIFPAIEDAA